MFYIIYKCAYSQIKVRKIGDKKFSIITAGSIFWPISRIMGAINEFVFRCFASFLDALTAAQVKIRNIGYKKFFVFTAGSIFWPVSRVICVINEFGVRFVFASFLDAFPAR